MNGTAFSLPLSSPQTESSTDRYQLFRKPGELPLLGDLLRGRRDHLALFDDCMRSGADIVEIDLCVRAGFVLLQPEAVRRALVADNDALVRRGNLETAAIGAFLGRGVLTTDGDTWLAHRRLNAPAFGRSTLADLQPLIEDSLARSFSDWVPSGGEERCLFDDFLALASAATTTAFLSTRPNEQERSAVLRALLDGPDLVIDMIRYRAPWLLKLPLPRMRRIRRTMTAVDQLIAKNAERRRTGPTSGSDLLELVLSYRHPGTGAALTPAEIRDQLFTAIIAAPENIATSLSWASYALASNPSVLATLRESLARGEMDYLRAVLSETMRRYAATPIVDRTAARDFWIGNVHIPRGSLIIVPILALHNHPRYWNAPEEFRPERFLSDETHRAYFPFGYGQRRCIGERLGRAVLEAALRHFVMEFDWSRSDATPPGFAALVNLRPKDHMRMRVERRAKTVP